MNPQPLDQEHEILIVMRQVLGRIVRETTPEHRGLKHPLSAGTIDDIKHAFALISAREREIAAAHDIEHFPKPRYPDSKRQSQEVGFTALRDQPSNDPT